MATFHDWLKQRLNELNIATMQGDEWQSPVNWAVIEDHILGKTCSSRRQYGDCHHKSCQEGAELAELAHRADMDEENLSDHQIDRMIKFINSKTCGVHRSGRKCGHRGCDYTVHLIEWLELQKGKDFLYRKTG